MTSLPTSNRPDSSEMTGVTQTTCHFNSTMEHNTDTSVSIITNAHPSDSWISARMEKYEGSHDVTRNTLSQPSTESPRTVHVMRFLSDTERSLSGFCYSPPTLPLWRFCSMAGKGLSSKRVEDVKMNRIDKLRAGRKRRANRRPFVFKSSPLAEGQGAGRLTQFHANTFAHPSPPFVDRKNAEGMQLRQTTFYNGCNAVRISRFSGPCDPTTKQWRDPPKLERPVTFAPRDCNFNTFPSWSKQPQISRLCSPKSTRPQSSLVQTKSDYQSWEISLPKCPFPNMGMFSN